MKTIEQQKQELTQSAKRLFNEGKSTEFVFEALKNYVRNSNFSRDINVDAIQYLVKQDLKLI